MAVLLALDQGTTVSKAALFTHTGRLLGTGRVPIATRFGRGGRAVQDPVEIIRTARLAIRRAHAAAGRPRVDVAGISSQRSTFVIWDRKTGRPVAPAPTWQSTVAQSICDDLEPSAEAIRQRTGLPLTPHYSASKIAHMLDGRPGLRRRAAKGDLLFGNVATWILWNLTKGKVHATDPTHAARTLLFGLDRMAWDRWLMDLFGVPPAMMPRVQPSLSDFGVVRIGGRDVPVTACLGDQQAALIGVTGLDADRAGGTALVNYGTGAFVMIPTGHAPSRRDGMLTSLAWTDADRRAYVLEGTINAAGATLDWQRREFGAPGSLEEIDALCRESGGETWLLPSFWGLGSAYTASRDAALPSVVVSTGGAFTRADLVRSAIEAIAHQVAVVLERGGGSGRRVRRLVATGSLSHLRYLMEFQAALLPGVAVARGTDREASLAGIASAAARAAGIRGGGRRRRAARPVVPGARAGRQAQHRHREWRRLIAMARIWKEVAEAYS